MTQDEIRRPMVPGETDAGSDVVREPGWYRNPRQPRLHRYWDGEAWYPEGAARTHPQTIPLARTLESVPSPRPRTA